MALYGSRINPNRFHISQLKIYAYLVPMALFMLLPIIFIFCHAFKPMDELFAFPPRFFVVKPTFENFERLFVVAKNSPVPVSRYVFNSIIVTAAVMVLSVLISSLAGFALSKMRFKTKTVLFEVNNAALMFVPIAVTIPRYLTIDLMGITDTYFAHILPLLAMPIGLFLIKQFIDQVPDSLIEAAFIDGASDFMIYRRIVVPLVKPALATAAILAFQAAWNNIETSALFINNESLRTLAFYMNTFALQTNIVVGQGMAAAGALIMFLPNLILFVILQSNVMNTMAYSGLK